MECYINFLGIGSAFNPLQKNTSAFFFHNDNLILLDCGYTVFQSIYKLLNIQKPKKIIVIITHTHNDHAGSLGTLISYATHILHTKVEVYFPTEDLALYLGTSGIRRESYLNFTIPPDNWMLDIIPYAVTHTPVIKCFGYEIHFAGKSFYYSGDAGEIPENVLLRFIQNKIDLIFQDTTFNETSHNHCPVSIIEKSIPVSERDRFFCMHLSEQSETERLRQKGFQVPNITKIL